MRSNTMQSVKRKQRCTVTLQFLEKNSSKTLKLDDETKGRISAVLVQQKQQKAFDTLLKNLREKAHVVYYEK